MMKYVVYIWLTLSLLMGCSSLPEHPQISDALPPIFPDYIGVTIPDGIAPLNFDVKGRKSADVIDVVVKGGKGGEVHANGKYARFDMEEWHALVHQNVGDSLILTVSIREDGTWTQYKPFGIYVSADALPEWGLTYRRVPPGYDAYGNMGIYQRNLSSFEEQALVENMAIDQNCVNCHTMNRGNAEQFTFHVRGKYGATIVGTEGKTEVLTPQNQELGGGMVYPFWHPSGSFIAYSTNETHQNFHQLRDLRVEVYDRKSDIIIYKPSTHEILLDSILAKPDVLENYPAFSPDGEWLYFTSAQRVDTIWKNYQDVKYDICRIRFDAATGMLGDSIETVVDARSMKKSANMPRISYDGRFLLYTMTDYGCFPIWHPEADLWMMDLQTGESFPLDGANSDDSESFHNWSLNSRWIVFTTRRDDGLYTTLYLAHVDEHGRASKPFCLPQQNPKEYFAETIYSFNTPEFVQTEIHRDKAQLYKRLLGSERVSTALKVAD
ncbi:MAG: PD40 domain-containing protein [Bacteroidaceae bacterium]|nr:PD40 domain-containing protein [Bacteroidaceae bacterium]